MTVKNYTSLSGNILNNYTPPSGIVTFNSNFVSINDKNIKNLYIVAKNWGGATAILQWNYNPDDGYSWNTALDNALNPIQVTADYQSVAVSLSNVFYRISLSGMTAQTNGVTVFLG